MFTPKRIDDICDQQGPGSSHIYDENLTIE